MCSKKSTYKYLIGKPCYSCFRYLPPPCAWRQVLLLLLPRFDGCCSVGWHSLWCKKRKRPRSPLLLGKWLSLPPLMVQPAATLLSEHGRDQKDFTGNSHPYQLVVSSNIWTFNLCEIATDFSTLHQAENCRCWIRI